MTGLLHSTTCYLAGAMEYAGDGGVGWRAQLTPALEELGIIVLDPCHKQLLFKLTAVSEADFRVLKAAADWPALGTLVRRIRREDLHLIHKSDFVIVRHMVKVQSTGTIDEACQASDWGKPVLLWTDGTQDEVPGWLRGVIHHSQIFTSRLDLLTHLREVDAGTLPRLAEAWLL